MAKKQHARLSVWIFGIFLLSIFLNYFQIFSVYQRNHKASKQRSQPNDLPTRKTKIAEQRRKAKSNEFTNPSRHYTNAADIAAGELGDHIQVPEYKDTNLAPVLTHGNISHASVSVEAELEAEEEETEDEERSETGEDNSIEAETEEEGEYESESENENEEIYEENGVMLTEKEHNDRIFFWNTHNQRKIRYIAGKTENITGKAEKESAIARANEIFVDLENDSVPEQDNPWFVLHIGPPKTATTAIQCGLEKYALRLAKTDGYHYLGGGCGAEAQEYIMPHGEGTFSRMRLMYGMAYKNGNRDLTRFVARTNILRKKGRSIILSSEIFGSQFPGKRKHMNGLRNAIVSEQEGAGFSPERVKVVLAYRHFIDWLPSFHYQKNSHNLVDNPFSKAGTDLSEAKRVEPFLSFAERYLSDWEDFQANETKNTTSAHLVAQNDGKTAMEPSDQGRDDEKGEVETSDIVDNMPADRQSIHPSWWLYNIWSAIFPLPNQVQVYDIHSSMNSKRPNDDTVTNFMCNVIPDANQTCSKLMHLEDERERQKLSNETAVATFDDTEPDYDTEELHTRFSWLFHKVPDRMKKNNLRQSASSGEGSIRKSTDLFAVTIIEELLVSGKIQLFNFSAYGTEFFETHWKPNNNLTSPEFHKGHFKKRLIEITQNLLDKHGIKAPNGKYFDCMSNDLEARFLNASLTFVDLIYKKTNMLTQSAIVSTAGGKSEEVNIEDEKKTQFQKAIAEHSELFEKNKAKGKYCDINPSKLFKEIPEFNNVLTSLSFKPRYKKMKFHELPEPARKHALTLDFDSESWNNANNRRKSFKNGHLIFENLPPHHKAAAFHLGYWDEFEE